MKSAKAILFLAIIVFWNVTGAWAQRDPVLKQIDVPHNYYFREMYLPQLTSGPSSVTWSPDSTAVIYAMAGTLWRQSPGSSVAQQLTDGPGYDYQPDWSPDGKWVAYAKYHNDAVSIWLLETASGNTSELIGGGSVNVEPKWSPDGNKLAYVSTAFNKRFHLFLAAVENGTLKSNTQLTQERRTEIYRYYYSPFDHELSPSWSPDGAEVIFVSNRDDIYGTGGFWRMKAEPGSEPREIRYEETTWKARPDWSPDGNRIIYSSYLGRQWHQLWIMTSEGGDPFPLTYGEFDITAPRWSRDGKKIAFISNKNGNTSLWIQETVGGAQQEMTVSERKYLHPKGRLVVSVVDLNGQSMPSRLSVTAADGRAYAPDDAWIHADDSFVRADSPFEPHYFHSSGKSEITVPAGKIVVDAVHGLEFAWERREIELAAGETRTMEIRLKPFAFPEDWKNWISGDLHVHMNYGGAYRNTPERLMQQAAAENLKVVYNLIVNKEQRVPDIRYFSPSADRVSTSGSLLVHSQEFHTSYWGHLGVLNLKSHFLIPDYSAYPNTGAASPYPTNAVISDLAHAQGAVVGFVHPFDTVPDPFDRNTKLTHELPADVALGKSDYFEVVGFSDHRATAEVWYRLLNCGFRLPAGAGTDAMANYASLRGPLGTDRVYVRNEGELNPDRWNENLKKGRTFVTNGPLLQFTVNEKIPGDEISLPAGKHQLSYALLLRSIVPVDHLEIVWNGKVVKDVALTGDRKTMDLNGTLPANQSGWLVLRAWNDKPAYPVLDIYPYATTSPIYVNVGHKPVKSPGDAAYFMAWMDRLIEATEANSSYNTAGEKEETLKQLREARAVYAGQVR